MKKVFISIPMNGRSEREIVKEIEGITNYIHHTFGEDIDVIHPLCTSQPKRIYYLGEALVKMVRCGCDTVVFAKGWKESRGCRIEEQAAIEYGLDRLYVDESSHVLCIYGLA